MPGRLVRAGGQAVHLLVRGEGPPLLLLHGLGGLAQEVMAPLTPLAGRFRLIAPDRPGYGYSDPLPAAAMRPAGQAAWIAALLDRLGIGRAGIVAHSLGAAPALALALDRPERVAGLVLLAPFCRPTRPAAMPWLRLATAPVVGAPLRRVLLPALAGRVAESRMRDVFAPETMPGSFRDFPIGHAAADGAVMAMAAELRAFNRDMIPTALRLRQCRVPTLVIGGTCDRTAEYGRHAAWVAGRLGDASLLRLEGAGHMPHHTRPARVAAAITAHVTGHFSAHSAAAEFSGGDCFSC
jgi:pimeloyl-ACP methyl ester carboxylesterase